MGMPVFGERSAPRCGASGACDDVGVVMAVRDPDFIIIGTMKSGTTALFRWLQEVSGSELCREKEPEFFLKAHPVGSRAHRRYRSLFPERGLAAEASVEYTDPRVAADVAGRIADAVPSVRLVCVLRQPGSRLRSHYRHQVQHGRERRPFLEAITADDNPYLRRSLYDVALQPFLDRFPTESVLVVQMERLVDEERSAWNDLLDFLGLPAAPHPAIPVNVGSTKGDYTSLMRRLYDSRALRRLESATPRWLRRTLRPLLIRHDPDAERLRAQSQDQPLPPSVARRLEESVARLHTMVPLDLDLWRA